MTRVKLQNVSPHPTRQWVLVGLPNRVTAPTAVRLGPHRGYADGYELHVDASLPAMTEEIHEIVEVAEPSTPFAFHPWVADDLLGLVPVFHLVWGGVKRTTAAVIEVAEITPVLLKVRVRALLPGNVSIEGWLRIYSGSPIVEFQMPARYGTTAPGQPRTSSLGSLSMEMREYAHVDFATAKGLHAPAWSQIDGVLQWETELVAPTEWHRAATFRVAGAILCLPAAAKFPTLPGNEEVVHLQARMTAPLTGLVEPSAWAPVLTPLGVLPEIPAGAQQEQARRLSGLVERLSTPGNALATRPYAQPPNSGQTGEQPDFGYCRAEHAVAMWAPWALWDLSYAAEAWGLRPYANREPDTSRVLAANHPNANTYNLRPDERFSRDDMLGWPIPVGWIGDPWWLTSDSQHRSDNLLFALYRLTRCDALKSVIQDLLQLEWMEYGRDRQAAAGSGLGAPRGWGRVLYSRLQAIRAGFLEFASSAERLIDNAFVAASYTKLPDDKSVRVLSDSEEKYGWKDGDGATIRCWLPWQEAIACVAFFAAWKLMSSEKARELALVSARTICRHAYFQEAGQWHVCYGVRWRTDSPGDPLPASSYNTNPLNFDVFVTGMQRWTNPALKVLLALEPDGPDADRARTILTAYGPPQNWDDACWGAV